MIDNTQVSQRLEIDSNLDSVLFDFFINKIEKNHILSINATLINNYSNDTINFLSTSCYGPSPFVKFDTSKLNMIHDVNCNTDYPVIQELLPKGKHEFEIKFVFDPPIDSIWLGFDLILFRNNVTPDLNLSKEINRPANKQNILWTQKKKIAW
jgi:hypothetical protein